MACALTCTGSVPSLPATVTHASSADNSACTIASETVALAVVAPDSAPPPPSVSQNGHKSVAELPQISRVRGLYLPSLALYWPGSASTTLPQVSQRFSPDSSQAICTPRSELELTYEPTIPALTLALMFFVACSLTPVRQSGIKYSPFRYKTIIFLASTHHLNVKSAIKYSPNSISVAKSRTVFRAFPSCKHSSFIIF